MAAISPKNSRPWSTQLIQERPESWAAGRGILSFIGVLLIWFGSLVFRFTSGVEALAAFAWLVGMIFWLVLQIWISRSHLPEKFAFVFSTIVQALLPVVTTVVLIKTVPILNDAAKTIALNVSINELIAIHTLRLAAWGTIAKYLKGQLPRYFFLYGSIPDFAFAIFAVVLTAWVYIFGGKPSETMLAAYSLIGISAFLGAAITMYFGVPGSALSWRWNRVARDLEAPTFLPFRWPMNLAPAFCGPIFWLAHGILIAKLFLT